MRKPVTMLSFVVMLMLTVGCQQDRAAAPGAPATAAAADQTAPTLTPEELGELGAKISSEPGRADELLARQRMTRETFEQAIRAVTENPDASKRYAEAYRKARA